MLSRWLAGHGRLGALLTMILLGALALVLVMTALGLAMMQMALVEAELVQQEIFDAQTFYAAETGLALIGNAVRRDFDGWEDAARHEAVVGPSGCFPVAGCGPAQPRRPAYATWAERTGEHAVRLIAIARMPGPAIRSLCPIGATGSVIEARLRRIEVAPGTYTHALEDWRHTRCPFSIP